MSTRPGVVSDKEGKSVEPQSRAVYILPAMLLVAGLIFVASRSQNRATRNRQLSPEELPLSVARNPFADRSPARPSLGPDPSVSDSAGAHPVSPAPEGMLSRFPPLAQAPPMPARLERMPPAKDDLPAYTAAPAAVAPQAATQVLPEPEMATGKQTVDQSHRISRVESSRVESRRFGNRRVEGVVAAKPKAHAAPASQEAVQAAFTQATRLVEQGKRFAEKQAHRSAKTEFHRALAIVAETLDRNDGGSRRTALREALTALRETDELFAMSKRQREANLNSLVLAHDTPILHGKDCSQLSLRAAMEMYFAFAQTQFVAALKDAPSSANGLFYLGKLHLSLASGNRALDSLEGPKAVACLQAATEIQPSHHHAANELGVMLARYGQWKAAKESLLQSLRGRPTIEAWNNLATVHAQLREPRLAALAAGEAAKLTSMRMQTAPSLASRDINQMVTWVNPEAFRQAAAPNTATTPTPSAPPLANAGPPSAPIHNVSNNNVSNDDRLPPPWRQPVNR